MLVFAAACRQALGIDTHFIEATDSSVLSDVGEPDSAVTPNRFCDAVAPKPTFCADFDGEEPKEGFYISNPDKGIFGGATLTFTEQNVRSAPRIASFSLPTLLTDTSFASGMLITTLSPQPPPTFTLKLDFRIEQENFPEGKGRVDLVRITFGKDMGAIAVFRNYAGLNLEVYTGMESVARTAFTSKVGPGSWHTLSLLVHNYAAPNNWNDAGIVGDASIPEGSGEVFALLGGLEAKLPLPPRVQTSKEPVNFDFGALTGRGPIEAFVVHLDNIVLDAPDSIEPQ